jgi:hypothetical protein
MDTRCGYVEEGNKYLNTDKALMSSVFQRFKRKYIR